MISLDYVEQGATAASQPTVCMHCEDPVAPCARGLPHRRDPRDADGVVHEAQKERCIGCANCVHACPSAYRSSTSTRCSVQVQPLLRPNVAGADADVRRRVPDRSALLRVARGALAERPNAAATDIFVFGEQEVRTGAAFVVPGARRTRPCPAASAVRRRSEPRTPVAGEPAGADQRRHADRTPRLPADPGHDLGRARPRRCRRGRRAVPEADRDLRPRCGSPGDIPAGGSVAFAYPGADDRAIAMRLPDGTLVAYSSICTHLSCAVLWSPREARSCARATTVGSTPGTARARGAAAAAAAGDRPRGA